MADQETSRDHDGNGSRDYGAEGIEKQPLDDPEAVDMLLTGGADGIDQDAIDALMAGNAWDTPRADSSGARDDANEAVGLTPEDIEALLAGVDDADALDEQMQKTARDAAGDGAGAGTPDDGPSDNGGDAFGQEHVDAMMRGDFGGGHAPAVQPPEQADSSGDLLDQDTLDALLASVHGGSAPPPVFRHKAPKPAAAGEVEAENLEAADAAVLEQAELDALVNSVLEQKPHTDADNLSAAQDGLLDQEFIDQLISGTAVDAPRQRVSAGMVVDDGLPVETEGPDVGGENLAAAATAEDAVRDTHAGLRVLERLAGGKQNDGPVAAGAAPGIRAAEPAAKDAAPSVEGPGAAPTIRLAWERLPGVAYVKQHAAKLSLALAAGLVVGVTTFTALYVRPTRDPGPEMRAFARLASLDESVQAAEVLMAQGNHAAAAERLTQALEGAPADGSTRDARYLRLQALFALLPPGPVPAPTAQALHNDIDALVQENRSHARAPQALRWKAELFRRDNALYAARDIYERLLATYGAIADLDQALIQAAEVALALEQPAQAGDYLRRLLRDIPGSPLAAQAKLMLGDVNVSGGDIVNARRIYQELADAQPGTALGAKAHARLGELACNEGAYQLAISILENRLATATTLEGNDEVYLLLAQAYRGAGQKQEAERVLQELLNFMPESTVTPLAFVELSRVLGDLGRDREAARVIAQAVQHYPGHPAVLRRQGDMLAEGGDAAGASRALTAAREAGASEAKLLLEAGRRLAEAGDFAQARSAFEQLQRDFPGTPEGFDGAIELASVLYRSGQVQKGLGSLERLVQATRGRPQHLAALLALGALYSDAGLSERAVDAFEQVATQANDPQVLAQAARAMLAAGALEQGLATAQRVEPARLTEADAYALLNACGAALLNADPKRAVDVLEGARAAYPGQSGADGDLLLLQAFLATGQTARARALVMEFDAQARRDPAALGFLQKAAIAWGDHLYERGDHRAAADAYLLALRDGAPVSRDGQWARFQRANALLALADYDQSLALFEDLSSTSNPWTEASRVKADYARLERRLRQGRTPAEEAG